MKKFRQYEQNVRTNFSLKSLFVIEDDNVSNESDRDLDEAVVDVIIVINTFE